MRTGPTIERASANDLLQLSFAAEPAATQIGAVLVLSPVGSLELPAVRAAIAERVAAVPRLRQRLIGTPLGCGRPVWTDDPSFEVDRHLRATVCPAPGGERELLDLASATISMPLPGDRPLWSITLVRDLAEGRVALVFSVHHVMVDGVGGLAVLGRLMDGASVATARAFPGWMPSRGELAIDAIRRRSRAVRRAGSALRRLGSAGPQLRDGVRSRAPRCSLNRPTGPRRRLAVARTELAALRTVAHRQGATVNDLLLTAVTGGLHALLRAGGEEVDHLVVSVPVSRHTPTERDRLGNDVGVVPVMLPLTGDVRDRSIAVARITRRLRSGERAATAVVLEPVGRLLGHLGFLRWYIDRQRRVNTFLTNLRGPVEELRFCGATVTDMIAVNAITGNVTVAFGALSYAGRLNITVVADPDVGPGVERLASLVQHELDQLVVAGA